MKISFTIGLRVFFFFIFVCTNIKLLAFDNPGKRTSSLAPVNNYILTETPPGGRPRTTSENPIFFPIKLPRWLPSRAFQSSQQQPLRVSADPVRFVLAANKTTVTVGEEIELTIQAVLLDIPPSLLFVFEEQKSFSLKLLVPQGFEITGGTYSNLVGTTLDQQLKPFVEYTVKGKFTQYSPDPFILLRGPKEPSAQSLFEKKAELLIPLPAPCTLQADQIVVFAPV